MSKSQFCTFYIFRHGETEWNLEHRIQGQSDSRLTKKGQEQAKKASLSIKGLKFAAVFSSDSGRAVSTTKLLLLEKKAIINTTALLRERYFGICEGKTRDELSEQLQAYLDLLFTSHFSLEKKDRKYDIETKEEMNSRIIRFLRQTALAYIGEKVLVITHGGVIHSLLDKLGYVCEGVENLAHIIVESDGVDFFLKKSTGVNCKLM